MLALVAGNVELVGAGLAAAVAFAQGGGAVRRAAGDFVHLGQAGTGIGHANDHHPVMEQGGVEGRDGGFLPAVLGGGADKHAAHLAHQFALLPQCAGLVEKVAHLAAHIAESRGRAEDHRVIVRQVGGLGNGRGLIGLGMDGSRGFRRHGFGHALDVHAAARHAARAFGHGVRHGFHMTPGAVIQNKNLCHFRCPFR